MTRIGRDKSGTEPAPASGAAGTSREMGPLARLGIPSTALWRSIVDGTFVFIAVFSPEGIVLEVNRAPLDAAGLLRDDVIGKPISDAYWWSYSKFAQEAICAALQSAMAGQSVRQELVARVKNGRMITVDCAFTPLPDGMGRVIAIAGSGVDVTARKDAEASGRLVARHLRMLTSCNQLLVRATGESDLLGGVCELIVDIGGYRMAWVGLAENDAAKSVRPVASAGVEAGYLKRGRIAWDSSPQGAGPTGRAIRECAPAICHRMEDDPALAPWRDEAVARGYHASIALPLIFGPGEVGALTIYSERTPAFAPEEVALLVELATDVAYGVSTLRRRTAHARAESQLQLFRRLVDNTNDLILVADAQTRQVIDANETAERRLGYSHDELLKRKLADFSTVDHGQSPVRDGDQSAAGPLVLEGVYRPKDAPSFPVEVSVSHVEQAQQRFLISVARDITERQKHKAQIAHLTRVRQMQSSINAAVLRIRDSDSLIREACRVASDVGGYDRATFWTVDANAGEALPVFGSGATDAFPSSVPVEVRQTEPDTSLISRAIRTGEISICSDLTQSHPPVSGRAWLIERGFQSLVAMPLNIRGKQGALTLASRDINLIGDEEVLLLQDIRSSLALALAHQESAGAAEYLAYFDALTGLAKRTLFCERFDLALRDAPDLQKSLTIAAFDIHGLANINDRFGRRVGDLLLQRVAERLRRDTDTEERLGYLGGGTFVLFEPGVSASAENIAALLDSTVFGNIFDIEGHSIRVSFLLGVARSPGDGERADVLVQNAEAALKKAKDTGERYLTYELRMHSDIAERLELEHKLRTALDEQQFVLHYQPQVNITSGRIEAVEALLRWQDPDRGLAMPVTFLPTLEASGLIVPVGDWILDRAVADCRRWRTLGLGPVRVAVNISALQLRRRSFVEEVVRIAGNLNHDGYGLDLEITESSLLENGDATTRKLQEVRAAGIRVALDDFGTGYSSLGLLSRLPVDVLKIDRSFISGLPSDAGCVALTSSVIQLASAFGLGTIAEGVETLAQMEKLRELRCLQSQGFLYSPAVPAVELESMLAAGMLSRSAASADVVMQW